MLKVKGVENISPLWLIGYSAPQSHIAKGHETKDGQSLQPFVALIPFYLIYIVRLAEPPCFLSCSSQIYTADNRKLLSPHRNPSCSKKYPRCALKVRLECKSMNGKQRDLEKTQEYIADALIYKKSNGAFFKNE